MAYCSNCGKELATGAKFCFECGARATGGSTPSTERQTVYDGVLHKCPNCGELLDSFTITCPVCDYELRGSSATNSVKDLALKLEQLEQQRQQYNSKSNLSQVLQVFGYGEMNGTDTQRISLIKSFAIPNTKEDVLEFAILAASNIDLKAYGYYSQQYKLTNPALREESDAWLSKLDHAYQKARLLFGSSKEYSLIEQLFKTKYSEVRKKKLQGPMVFLLGLLLLLGIPFLIALIGHFMG